MKNWHLYALFILSFKKGGRFEYTISPLFLAFTIKREKDLTEYENHALQAMLNYSDRLSAAYAMKEQYFKMFDSKDGT